MSGQSVDAGGIDLSIILLVWRDRAFLAPCLASLAAAQETMQTEIILVENGIQLQEKEYTPFRPRLIHNEQNRGVAAARNQGMRRACGRYLMLLDTDASVTQDALSQLVRFMDAHPEVGLAGPRLQDGDGNLQFTCRKLPTLQTKILRRVPFAWARAALADEMLAAYDHAAPRAVDYVIGACQIIRREAYERVGALDEQIFYGPEDVDYCVRMWRAGWRVMYVPHAVVTHHERRETKRRPFSKLALAHVFGLGRFFWKHRYAFKRPIVQASNTVRPPSMNREQPTSLP
jgi:N-acetylglucosaminyl-diphospho-decaprenol L-rhamnosyltransferase